jgi:membrane protein implicated in regulation of membrane protease activity
MQPAIGWLVVGLMLIFVELLSGTFYLLILGIACALGSLVAWAGGEFWLQALIAAVAAVIGSILVRRKKTAGGAAARKNQMDHGQSVVMESWVSAPQRIARVRYRGADWDAEVLGADPVEPGAMLFVTDVDGSRLKVSTRRPA